jgi:hypothetical protein
MLGRSVILAVDMGRQAFHARCAAAPIIALSHSPKNGRPKRLDAVLRFRVVFRVEDR